MVSTEWPLDVHTQSTIKQMFGWLDRGAELRAHLSARPTGTELDALFDCYRRAQHCGHQALHSMPIMAVQRPQLRKVVNSLDALLGAPPVPVPRR